MVRKAAKRDVQAIIELLHQVDMVHHVIRPDLFKPNTTKYNEQELEALLVKTLYIDDICVDEKARGKHVGTALYEYVLDYAKSIGCNNITLNVWEGNDPALSFYKNMGMKVQKTTMEIVLSKAKEKK